MARNDNADTKAAFKSCDPFRRCVTHINDEHVETAENMDIIMPIYNLLEYSDNYADSSANLYQFKIDKRNMNNVNPPDVTTDDSSSFKCRSSILGNLVAGGGANGVLENAKIVVPLKYLSNIFRSLEMPLINRKIHLEQSWRNKVMSNIAGVTIFQIKSTKLYVRIVTSSTKDNVNLTK